ncbi:hypothetical protein D3C81_1688730 [compost metagenome]
MRPGGNLLPAGDVFVLFDQHRQVKAPFALVEGFQQELDHSFFLQVVAHQFCRLLALGDTGRTYGL